MKSSAIILILLLNIVVYSQTINENLIIAVERGDKDKVCSLLEGTADVNARCVKSGYTPIMRAIAEKNAEMAELLLEKGADPNARDNNGVTPLMFAVCSGMRVTVARLLEKGALKHVVDNYGNSAVSLAARLEDSRMKALLEDVNDLDNEGCYRFDIMHIPGA